MSANSARSLESLKFSFIAWSIFLLFAAFVYAITYQLREVTVAIKTSDSSAAATAELLQDTYPQAPTPGAQQ